MIEKHLLERIEEKKRKLDSCRPFPKESLARLRENVLVSLTYNSNAIEGNSLTLQETRLVLEEGITIGGKSLREHLEAINHKPALDVVEAEAKAKSKNISEAFVSYLHAIVLKGISENYAGKYRDTNIRITGSAFTPPSFHQVPSLMHNFITELNEKARKTHPVETAAWAHFKLVDVHPFVDGNGRTARLLMNLILLKHGYPITIIQKAERKQYYRVLEQAHAGNLTPFANFVARSVERSLNLYLEALEPNRSEDDEWISLAEATKHCKHSQEYLSLLARKGKLEAIKIGRNWKTTRKALKEYLRKVHARTA